MKKSFILSLIFLSVFGDVSAQILYGLDPTFANNGIYMGDTGGVYLITAQPDKKIVVVENDIVNWISVIAVKRFNEDGTLDNSFATNGVFFLDSLNLPFAQFLCIYLQTDGSIILGGDAKTQSAGDIDILLVKLKPDGSLDSSYGTNGLVITDLGVDEFISSLSVQPDGKLVACGGINNEFLIARYMPDGSIDSSFDYDGYVWPPFNSWGIGNTSMYDIGVLPDGRIIVGGDADINSIGGYAFTAIRFLPNGSLDTSFNHTGIAYTNSNLPGLLYGKAMCLQPDGKILVAGYADSLAIARFDISGQLDNGFGIGGLIKLAPAGKVKEMLLQPDGKIVLATNPEGTLQSDTCYTIYRMLPNGNVDNSFGNVGKLLTKPANSATTMSTIALQTDGKLLAGGGYYLANNTSKILLVRYSPNATTVSAIKLQNSLIVYPNPANDYILIKSDINQLIHSASLYATDGKLLRIFNTPGSNRLATDGLTDGVYYLRLNLTNHQHLTQKVIIQKN